MAKNEKKNHILKHLLPKDLINEEDDKIGTGTSTGGTGTGGSTGEIAFRYKDPLSGPTRDDLLPAAEIKRLLSVHKEIHKGRVEKQKMARDERAAKKDGRYIPPTVLQQIRKGLGGGGAGGSSKYKKHPISDKAQFSGIDKQVVGIAAINEAHTNEDVKDALDNKLENRLQNRATPKFNPRPRPG
ncbi:MAG: hypothetical protein P4M14_04905 [Gammaproteobacteria bacterium]|nr:hypothetical protein [Gammaproteobacteria bacterium]